MDCSLSQLFAMMGGAGEDETAVPCAGGLFGEPEESDKRFLYFNGVDITIIAALYSDIPIDASALPPIARRLYALSGGAASTNAMLAASSPGAFFGIVCAWMSELPVTAEILRFGRKVLAAADRRAACRAATDRGDPDMQAVEAAAYKVWHEFDRLRGLLRFTPDAAGAYIARCEPDHFVLPALGPHFRDRFGGTPWAIIDEKRRLCLRCDSGQELELFDCLRGVYTAGMCPETNTLPKQPSPKGLADCLRGVHNPSPQAKLDPFLKQCPAPTSHPTDEWEDLWRLYHKTINNESRNNPDLQKQFMPKRYWKYLTEM